MHLNNLGFESLAIMERKVETETEPKKLISKGFNTINPISIFKTLSYQIVVVCQTLLIS